VGIGHAAAAIAGVDIGGTKTHLRWSKGDVERERVLPTAAWRQRGNFADAGTLLDLLLDGPDGFAPAAIGIGAHGCDTEEDCRAFQTALTRLTGLPLAVVNDAELLPLGAGRPGGIGVVVGTGSIAVSRRRDGTMLAAGGWGWILGDEGSAPAIVREAARAVRDSIDAGQEPDGLCEALRRSLDAESFAHFGRRLEELQNAAAWGAHARVVFDAAAAGSALAIEVIRKAATALATLVRRLVDRGAASDDVVAGGSVVVGQPLLYGMFAEELARLLPAARLTLFKAPPVAGAIVLARATLVAASGETGGRTASGIP
jgi:N-acetylglucosamine kinase-like BadF-type ATPase